MSREEAPRRVSTRKIAAASAGKVEASSGHSDIEVIRICLLVTRRPSQGSVATARCLVNQTYMNSNSNEGIYSIPNMGVYPGRN